MRGDALLRAAVAAGAIRARRETHATTLENENAEWRAEAQ